MNESETRAELIDPMLKASGWGEVEGSKVLREFRITEGKIQTGGTRSKPEIADYILVYKNCKIGVIEAKADTLGVTEGVAQAKAYAEKLHIDYTFSTNGKGIYEISMKTGKEGEIDKFPTPDELWNKTFLDWNEWKAKFAGVPNEGEYGKRYYQEIAINKVVKAVAEEKNRILLTMATGTGKTAVSFQIAWKLFQTCWKCLFYNLPNFHEWTGGGSPYFGDYPTDFFDFIIIDECHRGGAGEIPYITALLITFRRQIC
jgi:type I restriction enzyme R subunit